MKRIKILAIVGVLAGTVTASFLLAPSNIDPVNKFSWSENTGWMNWRDADGAIGGVDVGADFLSGFIWMENAGYVNVGNAGGPYANTDGTDFGVNRLGNDDLDGMAWGENIGWVNFGWAANTANVDRARFDSGASRLRGYAWAENAGWINLDDSTHYVGVVAPSVDPPGTGDDVCVGGSNAGGSCSTDGECSGGICGLKSRYVSTTPPASVNMLSIQVTLVDIDDALGQNGVEGQVWWAGASQSIDNTPNGTLNGAHLSCEVSPSNAEVWPSGVLHLFGAPIVPGSTFEVRMCDAAGVNCSDPLTVATGKWGDIVADFGGANQPNFGDITAVVDKFKSLASAPDMTRTDLLSSGGQAVDGQANFADISADVDAFKGSIYPYTIPACP